MPSLSDDSITTEIPLKIIDNHAETDISLRTDDDFHEGVSLLLSIDDAIKEELFMSDNDGSSINDDRIKPNIGHTNLELFEDTAAELFSQYLKVFTQPQALERSVKVYIIIY
uniref:Bm7906 n=1 Tax=Brugia malayi TaxID=6279 RepID=A0A1I9G8I6_BRUMA|nr:Bm7906 [Brugia malayi]